MRKMLRLGRCSWGSRDVRIRSCSSAGGSEGGMGNAMLAVSAYSKDWYR